MIQKRFMSLFTNFTPINTQMKVALNQDQCSRKEIIPKRRLTRRINKYLKDDEKTNLKNPVYWINWTYWTYIPPNADATHKLCILNLYSF